VNKPFSVYLDLVRFSAACLVYMYHSNQRWLVAKPLSASGYGHSSVIVFFVLSGFVIAYITDTKEKDWVSYTSSRISRVYSVVIPAVFLTVLLDSIGRHLYPAIYAYPYDQFVIRIAASLLLMNEIWLISITSFSNVPYWSICYEGWYYVAFAFLTFVTSPKRYIALAGVMLILGPKIVMLAPIWAAGVVLWRWKALQSLSVAVSLALVAVSLAGIVLFHMADVAGLASTRLKDAIGENLGRELTFSQFFLADYLLGLLVFCNFAGMRRISVFLSPVLLRIAPAVRFSAGFTFTLYLLHQPLILFWGSVVRGDPNGLAYWLTVTALSALSILTIGHFTESRRHVLRAWLQERIKGAQRAWIARRFADGSQ